MKSKLYLRINISPDGKHQLIRVDNIKEFSPILNDAGLVDYFVSCNFLCKQGSPSVFEPYNFALKAEIFDILINKVNSKIGSFRKFISNEMKLVQGSDFRPIIVIKKESV